jgi:hypothetical protein
MDLKKIRYADKLLKNSMGPEKKPTKLPTKTVPMANVRRAIKRRRPPPLPSKVTPKPQRHWTKKTASVKIPTAARFFSKNPRDFFGLGARPHFQAPAKPGKKDWPKGQPPKAGGPKKRPKKKPGFWRR